jgi:hypothetical protein
MAQAIVRAMAVNAAKGQHRAQRLFAEMLAATERQNKALADEWLETAITYKVEWDQELARRERLGITDLPAPLPHPDQVKIDMETGRAWIDGPATKEQVAQLEVLWARREDWLREVEGLERLLETEGDEAVRAAIEKDLRRTQKTLAIMDRLLG